MDKIAALTEILTTDPTNAFARYGLAMEHNAVRATRQPPSPSSPPSSSTIPTTSLPTRCPRRPLAKLGRTEEALDTPALGHRRR